MADFILTGPDGAKYKASGDNEEAVMSAFSQMFDGAPAGQAAPAAPTQAAEAPAAPAKPPSLVDRIMSGAKTAMGVVDQGVRGAVDGMANVVGLPGTLGEATGGGLGKSGIAMVGGLPFPSADLIKSIPNKLNDWTASILHVDPPRQKPDGMAERVSHRIGEEVGAMMVPAGGAVRLGTKLGAEGARTLVPEATGSFFKDLFRQAGPKMVESAATSPGKFIQRETTAATAAGMGAAGVNEMTGKSTAEHPTGWQEAGDFAGALTGLGTAATVSKLASTGKTLLGAATSNPGMVDGVVKDVAVDEIARAAGLTPGKSGVIDTAPLADKITKGEKVGDTIPGFVESTADRTKLPGLAATEYSRQSGPNSGLYTQRRTENTAAIDTAIDKSKPDGTPGALSSELGLERDRRLTDAGVARQNAEETATRTVEPLTPRDTASARGNTVRSELDTSRDTARQATADAYDNADVNAVPLQPTFLAEALDRTTAGLSQVERSLAPQGLIDRVAQMPAGEPATLREATSLRSILLDQQRAALTDPGRRYEARVLGQYVDAVEDVIGQSVTPAQRGALDTARAARRAEADAFERRGDPVAGIVARGEGGIPKMRDENVAALSTRTDALDRILTEADTPATRQAIRNQLLSNADTATAEGIQRFTQDYGEQLQRFPGLADELGGARTARTAEATARGAETDLTREIGPQGRGVVAKYLQYGDENASKAMRGVMASKDPAKAADELLSFVNDDPKAVEGARKVFWDIMQDKTRSAGSTTKTTNGTQPYLPAALKKFTEDPAIAAVAERLYRDNPEHWANVKKIAGAIQGVDVRNAAKAPNTSGTPQGLQSGSLPSMETIASRVFAVERGVVSPGFAALNIVGIIARKATKSQQVQAVNMAIDKALLDPEWAAMLLKDNNPANRAALRRGAKGWMGNEASTLADMLGPDDSDAETKKAAMKP